MSVVDTLRARAEGVCNSPSGLVALVEAILADEAPSPELKELREALCGYVLAKRRLEIWKKSGQDVMPVYHGSGVLQAYEYARERWDECREATIRKLGIVRVSTEEKRLGLKLGKYGAYRYLVGGDWYKLESTW